MQNTWNTNFAITRLKTTMTTQEKMQTQTKNTYITIVHCGIDKQTLKNKTFAYQ